jgi:hypothetical protein
MGLDLNCPSLLINLGKDPRARFRFKARPHAERLRNTELEAVGSPNRAWFFDLENKKWIRYSELSES